MSLIYFKSSSSLFLQPSSLRWGHLACLIVLTRVAQLLRISSKGTFLGGHRWWSDQLVEMFLKREQDWLDGHNLLRMEWKRSLFFSPPKKVCVVNGNIGQVHDTLTSTYSLQFGFIFFIFSQSSSVLIGLLFYYLEFKMIFTDPGLHKIWLSSCSRCSFAFIIVLEAICRGINFTVEVYEWLGNLSFRCLKSLY